MHLDVLDLRQFYYRTRLGRAAQRAVRDQIMRLWPEAQGQTVVGYGFAAPVLRPYLADARRVIALMPGPQGVMPWPQGMPNVAVMCEETWWPLETGHTDRLILMHGLETSDSPNAVLQEAWRVLGPGGKMLVVVPNRAGMWARRDRTPFGYGRPYSVGQLEAQLRKHQFEPTRHVAALFFPPTDRRFWLKAGLGLEGLGRRLTNHYAGGAIIVEASKQLQPKRPPGTAVSTKSPVEVLGGLVTPAPKPKPVGDERS